MLSLFTMPRRGLALAFFLAAGLGVTGAAQDQRAHPTMMVRIATPTPETEARLRLALPHLDVVDALRPLVLEALIYPDDLAVLRGFDVNVEVLHRDAEAAYARGLDAAAATASKSRLMRGSMGGYLTADEIYSVLDGWRVQYPNLITVRQSIGTSVEGRDQWVVKVSANADIDENEPEIYLQTLIHCREPGGMMSAMRTIEYLLQRYGSDPVATDLLDNREIWYVPVMNIDGYEYNRQIAPGGGGLWRKNRRRISGSTYGIDLNRNFGFQWGYDNIGSSPTPSSSTYRGSGPFSEPESQNVRDFVAGRRSLGLTMAWDIHTHGRLCMWPWGYRNQRTTQHNEYAEMTADMVAENGYTPGIVNTALYAINGGAVDWFAALDLYGWLPELGEAFWPPTSRALPLAEENLRMLMTAIQYSGPYLLTQRLDVLEIGNGDGNFDPGERIELRAEVRNRGVRAAMGATAELWAPTPFARIEVGSAALGDVASFTNADHDATPLRLAIPDWAAPGTRLPLEVRYRFGGHLLRETVDLVVGAPQVMVDDDCETRTWTTGVPGDDATDGFWTWGNPNPTVAHPTVQFFVQSGSDHTPGAGSRCYVTGNGGSSAASADDVDNGRTTLVTPVYDLSGARNPYVEFWRWYMDHGNEPNDDVFTISVTNDGGASWHVVDTVDYSEPAWERHYFRLRDFVLPTAQVQLRFVAEDRPNNSDCEAMIDDLRIVNYDDGVRLDLRGSTQIGQVAQLDLTAPRSAGMQYLTAVALGDTPGIPLPSGRRFPLNPDPLFASFTSLPTVFQNFTGTLDGSGQANASIAVPALPALVGATIYAAFVTLESGAPEGLRDISDAVPVTFQ
ncbi:MAG: M14 family metallopeptidase [Planctomycetota bacterium]